MMDVIIPVGDMPVTAQVTTPGKAIVAAQVSAAGYEAAMQAAETANTAAANADASAANADAATTAAKAATESANSASTSATESAAKADQATANAQAATTAARSATTATEAATTAAQAIVDYSVPLMSSTMRGGAKIGSGLTVEDETLSVDTSALVTQAEKGAANGVAELDQNGLVLSGQLPSYVDDVLEYPSAQDFPATGESGKIYVATDTNLTYRWTGSTYAEISPSLALGETSSTAYRGDRGAAAYAHAVTNKGAAFSSDLYKITTNSEGHVTAATPATSADIVAFLNAQALTPASVAATGAVSGSSVSDSVGSLADLRDSVAHVYQPSRPEKKDLLGVDLSDKNSPINQPHIVRADDVSTLESVPPGFTSGLLYGLWDCDVLSIYEGGRAQLLVTFREMVPVSGRVWTNWYNYQQWEGWKSVTPL